MLNYNQDPTQLDPTQAPQQGGLGGLLNGQISPMLALGIGLLQAGGPSPHPVGFGQALASGLSNMQNLKQQQFDNQYRQAQLQSLQQERQMKQKQFDNQQALSKQLNDLFGGGAPSNAGPTTPQSALPIMPQDSDASYKAPANSLNNAAMFSDITLPPKPTPPAPIQQAPVNTDPFASIEPRNRQLAQIAAATGNYDKALEFLSKKSNYGTPQSVVGKDGQPHLIQVDDQGNVREIKDYMPPAKAGTSLSVDPQTGAVTFNQGPGVMPGGFVKDPMMGPARGGQGGTYVNPVTGEIVSSNTNSRTSADQMAVAAVQRIAPQLAKVSDQMAPFLTAQKQGLTYAQGLGNKYLGTNFQAPSQQASGQATINIATEGLMKTLQLPSTNESLDLVKKAITPIDGESPQGYQSRMQEELKNIVMMSNQAKDRLAHGNIVQEATRPDNNALSQMAKDAIAQGADPIAVQQRMAQLQGGGR